MPSLPAAKNDFIGLQGKIHLSTGGEPPLLKAHQSAFAHFAENKGNGMEGYRSHWVMVDEVRAGLAAMTRLAPHDIALTGNASEAIDKVVSSFDWKPGDNVVAPALDYASGRFALGQLQAKGVSLRLVPSERWHIDTDALLAACDDDTRLVYISQVNALTGQHLDVDAISSALRHAPTALMVDVSHAIGVVPVRGDLCDFLVSCCYKFLLGIHEGILGWNRKRWPEFVPAGVGWHAAMSNPEGFAIKTDAQRAEYGNVGHLGAYILKESIDYLNGYGIEAIADHVLPLSQRLVDGMTAAGLNVMTPADPRQRAANAAFHYPDTESFVRKAQQDGVLVWGDNDRIRVSAHLFTTEADVDRFLDRLPNYLV
jgi:selenocysteine lyase/cysteine desulfurase